MSSAVVSTPAALGRPFVFGDADAEVRPSSATMKKLALQESAVARVVQSTISNQKSKILAAVAPASQLEIRPAPVMVSSGVPAIDALTGGLPRGCLTEICGPASSGRTTLLLAALAAATRRGEFCVVVDASDALDPQSAAAAGVQLDRLLWVRCGEDAPQKNSSPQSHPSTPLKAGFATEKHENQKHENQKPGCPISRAPFAREVGTSSARETGITSQHVFDFDNLGTRGTSSKENAWKENVLQQSDHRLEQVLRATDLLLESGGFGLIVLDLGDLPPQSARRIPLTTWFRYRRTIEHTPTILLTIEQQAIAGSCSSLLLNLGVADEPATARRKIATHSLPRASRGGVSRGRGEVGDVQAPEGRNKISPAQPEYPAHAQLLTGLNITVELIRSRLDRKPAHSIAFESATAWAG